MGSRLHAGLPNRLAVSVVCFVVALAVAVVADARPVYSTDPPAMRIEPASAQVSASNATPGTVFVVEIVVEGVTNLGAFEFKITTDPNFFKYGGFNVGPFFNSTGRSATCLQRLEAGGTIVFGCTSEGPEPPGPSGTGVVATIDLVFQGSAAGGTALLLSNCTASDVLGKALPISGCKGAKFDLIQPTPTPPTPGILRMQKSPVLQNVWLTRQGSKIPPADCLAGTNLGTLTEQLNQTITSPDPKDPSAIQQMAAFEFEVYYDNKKVCVDLTEGDAWSVAGAICIIEDSASKPQLEGVAHIGCVTSGKGLGINDLDALARIDVYPQPEIYSPMKPNQENGNVVQVNNLNCDLGDEQGNAIPVFSCDDADITFRYLEGDVEPDCSVDAIDAQAIAFRWGVEKGSLIYNDFMNLEPSGAQQDNDIDINDLQFVFGRFGSTCDDPHPPQEPVNPKRGVEQTPTATPSPTATPPPTATPVDFKPRVNLSPDFQELLLSSPPPSGLCSDSLDQVTFNVVIKDPITTEDPKDPSQLQMLGAFEFELQYDELFLCVDVQPGSIPQGEMNCITQQTAGVIQYGCTTILGSGPAVPEPPGVLAEITVRAGSDVYSIDAAEKLIFEMAMKNCKLSDLVGHQIKSTGCAGATISVHYP